MREITYALVVVDDDDCDELPLDDLPDALDQDYVDDKIVNLCRAFVEVRRASSGSPALDAGVNVLDCGQDAVQLVHFLVREFLLAATPPRLGGHIDLVSLKDERVQESHLAAVCLHYLQCANVWQDEDEDGSTRPFLGYAARFWLEHTAAGDTSYGNLQKLIKNFFRLGNDRWIA